MKAIGNFVVLKKVHEEVKKKSGLIITDTEDAKIRYKLAEIIAVGADIVDLSSGDKVYYDIAAGSDIRIDGEKLIVVNDRGIVVKL